MKVFLLLTVAVVATFAITPTAPSDDGVPVFISKFLSNPAQGRQLSEVHGVGNYTSYSGFITVNATTFSNMFFWFFPSQDGKQDAPLLLWLQGGPGGASMFGLFSENGPFSVSADAKTLIPNPHTWNQHFHMLYIDNPVGAGFSFTLSTDGYVRYETDVSRDLYSALTQFFQIFPAYQPCPFYVTGESYAGKYVPATAYKIHEENSKNPQVKINLKGIAVGDGAMEPSIQFTDFSNLVYYLGMADERESIVIKSYEVKMKYAFEKKEYLKAFHIFDELMNGDFYPYPTYFANITGTSNYFNFINPPYPPNPYGQYLDASSTRRAIHVGSYSYADYNKTVEQYLLGDWMLGVGHLMPTLLDNYKVLAYNGQNDIILGGPLAERFYRSIKWSGQDEYHKTKKIIWKLDKVAAGYVRQVRGFTQVIVRDAGHLLPLDQPARAFNMIENFVLGRPFPTQ
jgi:vitellogenic carboxypeptidase-like protein